MTANDYEEALANYAKEIELFGSLTLAALIDSHRYLRSEMSKSKEEQRAETEKIREYVEGLLMDQTWIKIDKLRDMTVMDLVDLIGE